MEARMGWGRVAVSDSETWLDVAGWGGGVREGGRANNRDFRSRFAVGESLAPDMVLIVLVAFLKYDIEALRKNYRDRMICYGRPQRHHVTILTTLKPKT